MDLDNPRAFPLNEENRGMTLRDYFAGFALQAMASRTMEVEIVAKKAYEYADAMLVARNAE